MTADEAPAWQALNSRGTTVWEGTENDVKLFVEEQASRPDLSVVAPDGTEFILEGGHWVPV